MKGLFTLCCLVAMIFTPLFADEIDDLLATEETTEITNIDTTTFSDADLQELLGYARYVDSINNLVTFDTAGTVELVSGIASIDIPEGFNFLDAKQAQFVMHDIWGNPEDNSILGLLMPEDRGPGDYDSWATVMYYVEEGFISDEDAGDIDYNDMLVELKKDTEAGSKQRVAQGYESVRLIGWAQPPHYNAETKKLYWAKELNFGDSEDNTLNYDIRILGRKGYLMMSAIGGMDQLDEINDNIEPVLASVNFNEGHRYIDFDPDIDEVAAYGIGALVAGKVLSKVGFLAILAKFGKFIAIGAVAAFAAIKKFFFGGSSES